MLVNLQAPEPEGRVQHRTSVTTSGASFILTPQELTALTGKQRYSAQARELNHMKIPFHRRSDGSLVVMKDVLGVREPRTEPVKSRVKLRHEWAVQ